MTTDLSTVPIVTEEGQSWLLVGVFVRPCPYLQQDGSTVGAVSSGHNPWQSRCFKLPLLLVETTVSQRWCYTSLSFRSASLNKLRGDESCWSNSEREGCTADIGYSREGQSATAIILRRNLWVSSNSVLETDWTTNRAIFSGHFVSLL